MKPITYEKLCTILLDAGVPVDAILKHRFVLRGIGTSAYSKPTDVDYNYASFTFRLGHRSQTLMFEFFRFSTKATAQMFVRTEQDEMYCKDILRPSLTNIGDLMIWLYPIEFKWYERLWIWLENKWIAVQQRYAKMRGV